jgi:LysR family hydrogen peroxide-inducible transcriptional activator
LFSEPLRLAIAVDHPIAALVKGGTAELTGQRLLTLNRSLAGAHCLRTCGGEWPHCLKVYAVTSLDAILLMAATRAGIAMLPDLFARKQAIHRDEVVVEPLVMQDAFRVISSMFPVDQHVDDRRNRLVEVLRNAARSPNGHVLPLKIGGVGALFVSNVRAVDRG